MQEAIYKRKSASFLQLFHSLQDIEKTSEAIVGKDYFFRYKCFLPCVRLHSTVS